MSEKALRTILIGVAVIVAAWAVSALLRGRPARNEAASSRLQAALDGLHEADVASVRLRHGGKTVELSRAGARWLVDGWPSDSATVSRFWSAVDSSRVAELAARNPAHQESMGVSGPEATEAVFRLTGGDSVRFLLGRAGPYYPSAYARLPGHDEVWTLRGSLGREASRTAEEWRDHTVIRLDTGAVRSVALRRGDTLVTLVRADSGWTEGGRAVAAKAMQRLLQGLARVEAGGFAPDTVSPPPPERTVLALGARGDTLALLRFAPRKPSGFWVTSRGDSVVYRLPSYRADQLTPTGPTLSPPPGSVETGRR
jgi:hypothetical protein